MTTREMATRLASITKEYKTTLAEHAATLTQLVEKAHSDIPKRGQN